MPESFVNIYNCPNRFRANLAIVSLHVARDGGRRQAGACPAGHGVLLGGGMGQAVPPGRGIVVIMLRRFMPPARVLEQTVS
jgi:hypothetical protein